MAGGACVSESFPSATFVRDEQFHGKYEMKFSSIKRLTVESVQPRILLSESPLCSRIITHSYPDPVRNDNGSRTPSLQRAGVALNLTPIKLHNQER